MNNFHVSSLVGAASLVLCLGCSGETSRTTTTTETSETTSGGDTSRTAVEETQISNDDGSHTVVRTEETETTTLAPEPTPAQ